MIKWNDKKVLQQVGEAVQRSCSKLADVVEAEAKRLVPVGEGDPTHLKDTIEKRPSKYKDGGYIVGVFHENLGKWEDTLGARAIFVEFGHAAPGDPRGAKVTRPQPFLRPAKDKIKGKTARYFTDVLDK